MKQYINNIYINSVWILSVFVMFLNSSCTGDFDKYNKNPYEPDEKQLEGDNYRTGAFFPQLQQNVICVRPNPFQLSQNLVGDIFSGYMATPASFLNNQNYATYVFPDGWSNNPYKNIYTAIFGAWMDIKKYSGNDPDSHIFAFAQILKVAGMHRLTDMWGPMAYSKVGTGSMAVAYDSQKDIYESFFRELTNAVTVLRNFVQSNPGQTPMKVYDLVYDGDYSRWIRFANSLKLRMAIRVAYADEELGKRMAAEAIDPANGGVIENNSDNATLKSAHGFIINNPLTIMWANYSDIRMGASITSIMNGYNDPRIDKYFQKSKIEGYDYIGLRTGVNNGSTKPVEFSSPNVVASNPIVWLKASEVAFLKAEMAIRGWDNNISAQNEYEKGVKLSFENTGSSGADTYLANSTATPADYVNPKFANQSASAVSKITIKWNDSADFEEKLERIITQKWLAIFPDGQEAWSEYRRTGYPHLFPVLVNNSGGTVDTKMQIRRLQFPYSERENNKDNYQNAVVLLGGSDNGGTRLWWDKNPKLPHNY